MDGRFSNRPDGLWVTRDTGRDEDPAAGLTDDALEDGLMDALVGGLREDALDEGRIDALDGGRSDALEEGRVDALDDGRVDILDAGLRADKESREPEGFIVGPMAVIYQGSVRNARLQISSGGHTLKFATFSVCDCDCPEFATVSQGWSSKLFGRKT